MKTHQQPTPCLTHASVELDRDYAFSNSFQILSGFSQQELFSLGMCTGPQDLLVGLITMQNPAGYGNSTSIEASINSRAQGESAAGLSLIIKYSHL